MRRTLPILAALLLLPAVALGAITTHVFVEEAGTPTGAVSARSLALLGDGRVAVSVLGQGGDLAVLRYDAAGAESGRWLGAEFAGNYQALTVLGDGRVAGTLSTASGPRFVMVDDHGAAMGGFALPSNPTPEPFVASGDAVAIVAAARPPTTQSSVDLRLYALNGELRAIYSPVKGALDEAAPGLLGVQALANGDFLVLEPYKRIGQGTRFGYRRLDPTLATRWAQDFAAIPGEAVEWQHAAELGEAIVVAGRQPQTGGYRAVLARIDASGALAWHVGSATFTDGVDVAVYAHAGGVGVLGIGSPATSASCVLQGAVDAAGNGFAATCTATAGVLRGGIVQRRAQAGGVEFITQNAVPSGLRVDRVARFGTQAATVQSKRWDSGQETRIVVADFDDGQTAVIAATPWQLNQDAQRLLRWNGGEDPVVDSLLPATDRFHEGGPWLRNADGSVVYTLRADDELHVALVQPGGIAWDTRVPVSSGFVDGARAADGGYRVQYSGARPGVHALRVDGSLAWSYVFDTDVRLVSTVAALPDGGTLIAYGAHGASCRVRKLDAAGVPTGDVDVGGPFAGEGHNGVSLDGGAVFVCRSPGLGIDSDQLIHVDAALNATVVNAPDCRGQYTETIAMGGDRWATIAHRGPQLATTTICTFEGVQPQHGVSVVTDSFTSLVALPMPPANGVLHLGWVVNDPAGRIAEHVVYDDAANTATRFPLRVLQANDEFLGLTAPDAQGRVLRAFGLQGERFYRIEYALAGQAAEHEWRLPRATDTDRTLGLATAGSALHAGTSEGHTLSEVVYEAHVLDTAPLAVFADGFE